ncbi:MAG: cyclic nucleotide-binding domain-containing protein, partial [Anaerolineae bacterium]
MKLRYLSKAPLLGELPHAFLEQIAEKMRLHTFARGETIFSRGGPSDALYLIKSGWIHLRGEGNTLIATLGPGNLLGEVDVLLQQPHSAGATAADAVEAWSLSAEALNELIRAYPENGLILSEVLGQRIAALEQYLVDGRLRALPAFASLPDEILKAIAGAVELTRFPAQSLLFREGEPAPGL